MNIRNIKKAGQRIDVRYLSSYGIKTYGSDNLYPQEVSDIIDASSVGKACLNRYARFIEGGGFKNVAFAETIVNRMEETADELCKRLAQDLARYNGFAIHVNYDVFGNIVELQHVPFENCRLKEDDDAGYIAYICVHPDWRGSKTRNGKILRVSRDTIEEIPIFNPRREVVARQIMNAGGIENYRGQILWVSGAGKYQYPTPIYDSALTELSADEGLSNVKFRNVRNNFLPSCAIVSRTSQSGEDGEEEIADDGFSDTLREYQCDEKSCNILEITVNNDEEKPEIISFPTKNYDKDFTVTDESVTERIYATFEQEPFYSIRKGKLGFSGDVINDAYNYYASIVGKEQRMIERAFDSIFKHWGTVVNESGDYGIRPLQINKSQTDAGTNN